MPELRLPPEEKIALYDRFSRTALEAALTCEGPHPALAEYYADLALHYDKVARRIEDDLTGQIPLAKVPEKKGKKKKK